MRGAEFLAFLAAPAAFRHALMPKKIAAEVPARRPVGRPPGPSDRLTMGLVAEIVDRIEKGALPLSAAVSAGVTHRTWHRWLRQAEDGSKDKRLQHLLRSIERAKGRLASRYYATINEVALGHERVLKKANGEPVLVPDERGVLRPVLERIPGQWQAAVRELESLVPEEFLRRDAGAPLREDGSDHTASVGFEIVYLPSNRDPEELAEINRRIERRASRATDDGSLQPSRPETLARGLPAVGRP